MAKAAPRTKPAADAAADQIVWREPDGTPISCLEKNKVLNENLDEIREICQDALEDAVLMGVDEDQVRSVFRDLIADLENPYKKD